MKDPKETAVVKYLAHLDKIFQREPEFFRNESTIEGVNDVSAIVYRDYPTIGYMTAVTYGLSLVEHPDYTDTRPELCICVESDEINWGIVIGHIANHLRGKYPFTYGFTIDFKSQVAKDSEMDAFLVFAPTVFEREEWAGIDVGEDYKINLTSLYPIYASELEAYNIMGIEDFWKHPNFHPYNVRREKVSLG
ncbi:suppressor of fused domain protein [Moheibacter stercoris]|uniref:Suppressor of fused-like domain-containing protein n=1 Tax=Moheibacter stercoris TaxID=1628251 RepID=A0ABV2LSV8_9FLAO